MRKYTSDSYINNLIPWRFRVCEEAHTEGWSVINDPLGWDGAHCCFAEVGHGRCGAAGGLRHGSPIDLYYGPRASRLVRISSFRGPAPGMRTIYARIDSRCPRACRHDSPPRSPAPPVLRRGPAFAPDTLIRNIPPIRVRCALKTLALSTHKPDTPFANRKGPPWLRNEARLFLRGPLPWGGQTGGSVGEAGRITSGAVLEMRSITLSNARVFASGSTPGYAGSRISRTPTTRSYGERSARPDSPPAPPLRPPTKKAPPKRAPCNQFRTLDYLPFGICETI